MRRRPTFKNWWKNTEDHKNIHIPRRYTATLMDRTNNGENELKRDENSDFKQEPEHQGFAIPCTGNQLVTICPSHFPRDWSRMICVDLQWLSKENSLGFGQKRKQELLRRAQNVCGSLAFSPLTLTQNETVSTIFFAVSLFVSRSLLDEWLLLPVSGSCALIGKFIFLAKNGM